VFVSPSETPEPPKWEDAPDEWSDAIKAAFPTRSGSHDAYATAMQMVGNRQSKGELVALVNWLLVLVARRDGMPRKPRPGQPIECECAWDDAFNCGAFNCKKPYR
jgi:hypothetical protein